MAKKFKDVVNIEKIKEEPSRSAAAVLLEAQSAQENQKDARLALRIDKALLSDFRKINQIMSVNGSNVLRAFISEYVNSHRDLLGK